jgi:hypothetical protein
LLATRANGQGELEGLKSADVLEGEGESLDRRPAVTATNVKALFDGPGPYPAAGDTAAMGFAGPLSYHNPQRAEYWQPTPVPAESESNKRDSDPIIQEKVRQASHGHHPHPLSHAARNVSARTQSLDISTMNFSRTLSGSSGAFAPIPPSPVAASSNGQYIPVQHLRANITGRGVGNYDSAVDGVTQGE